ncbi:hypothetical protein AMTR_s00008p00255650 [Amborella trichopoda]|uniref:Aminotransferase-like plant mobile domain-containing protein n=1 Tax=Amborella trichopoda TaxID=13333 RepID=W1NJU2_AMBTC|nr:hypothetical protein AMTR_s00008p00255650 [Amborella trichopoda]
MGGVVDSWAEEALGRIGLWEVCWIRPFTLDLALLAKLCLRYRSETCSIPLRCGELAPTLEDVTRILGVRSEGEPFLSIPLIMSTSYAFDCKELLGIPFEKIKGWHDSEIHLGKLRWEFTRVPHRVERMMDGCAPQGEFSHPSSRGAARSSGDAEGVGHDIPDLGDGSAFFDEDTVPLLAVLIDEE